MREEEIVTGGSHRRENMRTCKDAAESQEDAVDKGEGNGLTA